VGGASGNCRQAVQPVGSGAPLGARRLRPRRIVTLRRRPRAGRMHQLVRWGGLDLACGGHFGRGGLRRGGVVVGQARFGVADGGHRLLLYGEVVLNSGPSSASQTQP